MAAMAEFNIRSDAVDVEQIMRQIRARIRDKRGVDYTEQQIQELATVKLERFLDPKGVRSDLVDQFHRSRGTTPDPPKYEFEDTTLFESTRGVIRLMRRLLQPILKLFFNPNPLIQVLHTQSDINAIYAQRFKVREELDALYYELIHNLVLELTRLGIETKNLKMQLESISSRLNFDERRARALEGVVQYRPGTASDRAQAEAAPPVPEPEEGDAQAQEEGGHSRRRRRRRGRRGRHGAAGATQTAGGDAPAPAAPAPQPDTASARTEPQPSSGGGPGDGSDASGL
jgi:hypothetical protein